VSLWLFNPFVINVSTRGNNESFVSLLILATAYFVLKDRIFLSSICYGLAVHMRMYPIIYAIPLFFFVGRRYLNQKIYDARYVRPTGPGPGKSRPLFKTVNKVRKPKKNPKIPPVGLVPVLDPIDSSDPNPKEEPREEENIVQGSFFYQLYLYVNPGSIGFALISFGTFILITGGFYYVYGDEFLQETYFHHITRQDNRHNFSVYFYHIYLTTSSKIGLQLQQTENQTIDWLFYYFRNLDSLLMFVPQAILLLILSAWFYRSLFFSMFILTFIFVMLNKVCTMQYHSWYFSLLPLILPESKIQLLTEGVFMAFMWIAVQAGWLYFAYCLEFLGQNTFFEIWILGILYFEVNVLIVVKFVKTQNFVDHTRIVHN